MDMLRNLLVRIARALVDKPDEITVKALKGNTSMLFELTTAKSDVGKVIGRQGKTADAVRTILSAAAARTGLRCNLEIIEDPKPLTPPDIPDMDMARAPLREQPASDAKDDRVDGVISRLSEGYGFIRMLNGNKPCFFHWKDVLGIPFRSLSEGLPVTFKLGEGPKGPIAKEVRKA